MGCSHQYVTTYVNQRYADDSLSYIGFKGLVTGVDITSTVGELVIAKVDFVANGDIDVAL